MEIQKGGSISLPSSRTALVEEEGRGAKKGRTKGGKILIRKRVIERKRERGRSAFPWDYQA